MSNVPGLGHKGKTSWQETTLGDLTQERGTLEDGNKPKAMLRLMTMMLLLHQFNTSDWPW
ncbi:hypothetical protein FRB94_000623, partial [Tulasnella sp. JGI-2019a]